MRSHIRVCGARRWMHIAQAIPPSRQPAILRSSRVVSGSMSRPGELRGDVPRKQFFDPIDRMFCDAFEHVAQIRLRVEIVEFGGSNECVDGCSTISAIIGPSEHPVLSAERARTQRALRGVVVYFNSPVVAITCERRLTRQCIADRRRQLAFFRDRGQHESQPTM